MPCRTILAASAAWLLCGALSLQADNKPDYADLSKRIHQAVIPSVPKEWEDYTDWGTTIPIPDKIRLTGLRTRVKVGDREELPHGGWKRTKLWFDDPPKNIQLEVRDLRKQESGSYRLLLDATVALHGERQRKQWSRGLLLFDITARADAVVTVGLDFDVKAKLNITKFPPELEVEPKVLESRLLLKQFN